ncbi:MAG TPA: hypothetical protein VKA55_09825 [Gammaproteobacteria bacterium]|nr:hypothetical protein [Gammaproteobacteria bacterium]
MTELPEAAVYLAEAGRWAPSADNMQPWLFRWRDGLLELRFARKRLGEGPLGPTSPATQLAMGAVIENWQQAAASAGLALDWLDRPDDPELYARVRVPEAPFARPRPDEVALFGRCTNRGRFRDRPLPPGLEERLAGLEEPPASLRLTREPDEIQRLAGLTRRASSVRFRTGELHQWFVGSLRWTAEEAERGDGLDLETLALPPGGRWVLRAVASWPRLRRLNRLGAFRLLASLEARPLAEAPGLVLVHAPDDPASLRAAGQTMQRAWIALNRAGLAVQPFYVLPDQLKRLAEGRVPAAMEPEIRAVAEEARGFQPPEGGRLLMVLRLGEPAAVAVPARRLPLERLIETAGGAPADER